jgi:E3 ubiquitin-protein ligase CHFR
MSTNGTYLNDKKVGKNNIQEIKSGDSIFLLHYKKVKKKYILGFIFSQITDNKAGI